MEQPLGRHPDCLAPRVQGFLSVLISVRRRPVRRGGTGSVSERHGFTLFVLVLLAIGLCHMLLIWNGDISHAACRLRCAAPSLYRQAGWNACGIRYSRHSVSCLSGFLRIPFPGETTLRAHAAVATQIYSEGSFG